MIGHFIKISCWYKTPPFRAAGAPRSSEGWSNAWRGCEGDAHPFPTEYSSTVRAMTLLLRGVRQLLVGKCVQKERKRCRITRNKIGAEGSRTDCEESQSTLGETAVSRGGGNTSALWSLTQEEPPLQRVYMLSGGRLHFQFTALYVITQKTRIFRSIFSS